MHLGLSLYLMAKAEMIITRIPTPIIAIGRIPARLNDEVAFVSRAVTVVFHAAGILLQKT